MRAIAKSITIVAAALMIAAVPVFAVEGVIGQAQPQVRKNECLLVAQNCPSDTIQVRIQRIKGEIAKGTSVYTKDELQRLNRELESAQKFLDYEMTNE